MTFDILIPSTSPSFGDVYFTYSRQAMDSVLMTRQDLHGATLKAEVTLSTLTKIVQAFKGAEKLHGLNGLSLKELSGNATDFPLSLAEANGFVAAFARHRATEAIKKTLANLETSSAEELIKNFEGIDLWDYLALHDEPKPSPLV